MLTVFRFALPTLILMYFLYMSTRARVYLLGLPFLMFMSNSIFFDRVKVFWMPGRLDTADLIMLWMVVVWLVCSDTLIPGRRTSPDLSGPEPAVPRGAGSRRHPGAEEAVLLLLAGLALVNVVMTATGAASAWATLGEARGVIYLFAGYLIIRSIVSHAKPKDVVGLLRALVVVNTLAAVLFILHQGLHLQIYSATEYLTFTFMGQRLTRSFYFMPQLLGLAVAYAFAARRWSWWLWGVAVVSFVAVWITYTRSLLVIAFVEAAVVVVLRLLRGEAAGAVLKRAAAIAATAVLVLVIVFIVFPVQTEYFFTRLGSTQTGDVVQEKNLVSRWNDVSRAYRWSVADDPVLGSGFVAGPRDPRARVVEEMASDIVWVPVLFRLGMAGVVLVVLLYVTEGVRAVRLALRGDESVSTLGVILVAVLVGSFMEGFVSWTFMQPSRMPMGLWVFAIVAGVASSAAPATAVERRRDDLVASRRMERPVLTSAVASGGARSSTDGGREHG